MIYKHKNCVVNLRNVFKFNLEGKRILFHYESYAIFEYDTPERAADEFEKICQIYTNMSAIETITQLKAEIKRLDDGWQKSKVLNLGLKTVFEQQKKAFDFAFDLLSFSEQSQVMEILKGKDE